MSKIKIIQQNEATGRLLEIYNDLISKRGKLAEVHKIQSLRPESIVKHMDLYLEIMFSKSALSRAEREMMAVVVSASNRCYYCQIHHAEALNNYWKDSEKVELFRLNFTSVKLSEKENVLCDYANRLTLFPTEDFGLIEKLKATGFSDEAILDATLVVSYFNFVNRMVLGLGVNLEENASGYKY